MSVRFSDGFGGHVEEHINLEAASQPVNQNSDVQHNPTKPSTNLPFQVVDK
jgi:hypothetical protein